MLERSHEEQEQLIASLESIVECYKMEMALNRLQRDELADLKFLWNEATKHVMPGEYDTAESIEKYIRDLQKELQRERHKVEKLISTLEKFKVDVALVTQRRIIQEVLEEIDKEGAEP